MCRGYYTRAVLTAWDWDGSQLTSRWVFDSNNPGYSGYAGQGNHNLSVADVDSDGKDEIVYGACTIDDNGKGLYTTGLGHGDALHVSDFDPSRPGLEVFSPHESNSNGVTFRDAATGEIIWQKKSSGDTGRGLCADISGDHKGAEYWASSGLGVFNTKGEVISSSLPSVNFAIWWDGDDLREILNSNTISKWGAGTLLTATGCSSNNSTKSTPNLSADLMGDWREEVIFRTNDNRNLRVFLTSYITDRRLYTLMHDSHYRLSIAWQNVAYNQPPHTGFFFGNGMATPPPPKMAGTKLVWNQGSQWDVDQSVNWLNGKLASVFKTNDDVQFDLSSNVSLPIQITGNIQPKSVMVNQPSDIRFNGSGTLSGPMQLVKNGKGKLIIEGDLAYSGNTMLWQGGLIVNGEIKNSAVFAQSNASVGGKGKFGNGLTIENGASLFIGQELNEAALLQVEKQLVVKDGATLTFDLSDDPTGIFKNNDRLVVNGNLLISGENTLAINLINQKLSPGNYELIKFSGDLTGTLSAFKLLGLSGITYELKVVDKSIILTVIKADNTDAELMADNHVLQIFPNPFVSRLTVNRTVPFVQAEARLYDVIGKLCFQWEKLQGSSLALNITGLKKGIYCLKISDVRENFSAKVVKE
jgi:autotransporter-associated beta strand protein